MKTTLKNTLLRTLGLAVTLCFLVNCQQRARLEPNRPQATAQPQTQTPAPAPGPISPKIPTTPYSTPGGSPKIINDLGCKPSNVKAGKIVKVLFVVDASGSNFGEFKTTPSDPDKHWRRETLRQFIAVHLNNKNFYYGLAMFKGTSARARILVDDEPGFTNDRAEVAEGFKSFLRTPDGGDTPYKAALKIAKETIAADLKKNARQKASYAVVIVSDGHATDYKNAHDVIPDAATIKELAPSRITLNGLYYSAGNVDTSSAPQFLKNISEIGEGAFIVANTHQHLNLDSAITVAPVSCQ
jgi:hypothetical protein